MADFVGEDGFRARTIAVWSPRVGRRLTDEDAREIAENVIGFFRTLLEWDRACEPARAVGSEGHDRQRIGQAVRSGGKPHA